MGATRSFVIVGMILAAAAARLVPHPPNFVPIAAMALFAGATLSRRWQAFTVPLAAMVMSDLVIDTVRIRDESLSSFLISKASVYGCFVVMVCMGFAIRARYTVPRIAGTMLTGSILFFIVTNFWAWYTGDSLDRPMNLAGLIACYVDALPYFQNTLLGDAFFTVVLFGGFALAEHLIPALREPRLALATDGPHDGNPTDGEGEESAARSARVVGG